MMEPTAPEMIQGGATTGERSLARVPLVLNRRNFSWITERISGVVEERAPRWWWVCFTITGAIAMFGLFCIGYQISTGVGVWGNNIPNRMGLGYYELRFLDRYRTRRHADFGHFVFVAPKMADFHQPFGRSYDAFRGDVRGDLSGHSCRPRLDGVVSRSGSE